VSNPPDPTAAPFATIGFGQLIGFGQVGNPIEWGRIRAAQLSAGRELSLFLLGANLVAAAMVASTFGTAVPLWQLAGWGLATVAAASGVTVRRRRGQDGPGGFASLGDLRETAVDGVVLALVWAVPPLFFAASGTGAAYGLWMILSVLMTAAAVAMAPLMLATVTFLSVVGAAVAGRLAWDGALAASIATLLFTALLILSCLDRARSLVVIRAAQLAVAERDDTVSLLLREFEDQTADWLWETDAARRVVKASPRFAFACGLDPLTINGMPFLQVLAGPSWETGNFAAGLRDLADKLKARDSFRDLRLPVIVDSEERWWEIAASPRYDEFGVFCGFRGVGSDVTEQRASADKINRMARYDTLTGLPNRLLVKETLTGVLAEADKWGGRCALLMIDLDRFKAVNDTLGHPVGDTLLIHVSARLDQMMTANEICGRLGGDEFAIVVRDARDTVAVQEVAQRVIETLSRPYEVDQHTLYIGASVGLAIGPRDGRTVETLVRSADLALYRSKDAGGNVCRLYEPQLHTEAEERRVLEIALRQAVEQGHMHLEYQPVVDADTARLIGFEALLRWAHPEFGNVSPTKFVPLAEEMRLIAPIGEWVLRAACAEAARWPDDVRVAVNVSPDQLHDPNFVTVVAQALSNTGLRADRLELEVTESVFMREGTGAVRVLERILQLGVHLSLDDFGTGYSSLGYLSRTSFSTIKVDRSFVQGASQGVREAVAIVRAVVALARSLGMATTAEGVETEAEYAMSQELGCSKVQGYYFSRPLPAAEARDLANRGRRKDGIAA